MRSSIRQYEEIDIEITRARNPMRKAWKRKCERNECVGCPMCRMKPSIQMTAKTAHLTDTLDRHEEELIMWTFPAGMIQSTKPKMDIVEKAAIIYRKI